MRRREEFEALTTKQILAESIGRILAKNANQCALPETRGFSVQELLEELIDRVDDETY